MELDTFTSNFKCLELDKVLFFGTETSKLQKVLKNWMWQDVMYRLCVKLVGFIIFLVVRTHFHIYTTAVCKNCIYLINRVRRRRRRAAHCTHVTIVISVRRIKGIKCFHHLLLHMEEFYTCSKHWTCVPDLAHEHGARYLCFNRKTILNSFIVPAVIGPWNYKIPTTLFVGWAMLISC